MILVLVILVPCCLVGLAVYAGMSRWEINAGPSAYHSTGGGGWRGGARDLPRPTFQDSMLDWPIPQFRRAHPAVLLGLCTFAALWIVAWIVLLFVGLSMLHA